MYRFIQFFDFEAYLKDDGKDKIHHPVSFCEITLDTKNNQIIPNKSYLGDNCVDVFLDHTLKIWNNIHINNYPLHMSNSDEINYQNSMNCKICKRMFSSDMIKVMSRKFLLTY